MAVDVVVIAVAGGGNDVREDNIVDDGDCRFVDVMVALMEDGLSIGAATAGASTST